MGSYDYEIRQALREIVQEVKGLRREIKTIRERLTESGGLTAATTRRAHLIVDGDKQNVYCSACGKQFEKWNVNIDKAILGYETCLYCGAIIDGDAEIVSGGENECAE